MKYRIFFLMVVSAMIIFGCGQETATSPDLTQSEQAALLAKRTITPFTAVITFTDVLDPGRQFVDADGVLHIQGLLQALTFQGDIEGPGTAVINAIFDQTGSGPTSGSFTVTTATGVWEGGFKGQSIGSHQSGDLNAEGSGGLAGMGLLGNFQEIDPTAEDPDPNIFNVEGRIGNLSHSND